MHNEDKYIDAFNQTVKYEQDTCFAMRLFNAEDTGAGP